MQVVRQRGYPVRGMTLIEMVVSLLLISVIGAAVAVSVSPAIKSFLAQTQRATLVDATESALRRMARDIRIALPNSVRITNTASGFALEVVPTVDGGRYCATGLADCSTASQLLDFSVADNNFDILGCFEDSGFLGASGGSSYRLVIGNTGNEVYSGAPAVMTASGTTITITTTSGTCGVGTGRHHVALGTAFLFGEQSPRQRVFVVQASSAPVSYICDWSAGTLTRYAGYTFQSAQPTTAAAVGAATSTAVVAKGIPTNGCSVTSTTSNVQNTGIVILTLSLQAGKHLIPVIGQFHGIA